MGWNGSGGYTRAENFSADSSAGVKILATRVDTEFDDFASAITLAWARDGQNRPSANLNMGGYRLTNAGAAASAEDFLRVKEFIRDVPVYVKDSGPATRVQVSVGYYTSVSAGQSPPDGSRLKILMGATNGTKTSATCPLYLYTPLNTSVGGAAHIAPIWTRGRKFDPSALRANEIYEFVYDASASGWHVLNPSRSFYLAECRAKVIDNIGTVAGKASASVNVYYSRNGNQLTVGLNTSVSVSTSISGQYLVLSAPGVTSMTSGMGTKHVVPITVKDVVSHTWAAQVLQGGIYMQALFSAAGTTVSANTTIRAAPFTIVMMAAI